MFNNYRRICLSTKFAYPCTLFTKHFSVLWIVYTEKHAKFGGNHLTPQRLQHRWFRPLLGLCQAAENYAGNICHFIVYTLQKHNFTVFPFSNWFVNNRFISRVPFTLFYTLKSLSICIFTFKNWGHILRYETAWNVVSVYAIHKTLQCFVDSVHGKTREIFGSQRFYTLQKHTFSFFPFSNWWK